MTTRSVFAAKMAVCAVVASTVVACGAPEGTELTLTASADPVEGLELPRAAQVVSGQLVTIYSTGDGSSSDPGPDSPSADSSGSDTPSASPARFELGDVGPLPTLSTGYYFDPSFQPDETTVRRVVGALELANSLQRSNPAQSGDRWVAGDPAGRQFRVPATTPAEWTFEDATEPVDCGTTTGTVPQNDARAADCNPIGPTAIELTARELMMSLGNDVASMVWRVDKISDDVYRVRVKPAGMTDEMASAGLNLEYEFTYNRAGRLTRARGPLADPARLGPYPLIDAQTSLDRLNASSATANISQPPDSGDAVEPGGFAPAQPDSSNTDTDTDTGAADTVTQAPVESGLVESGSVELVSVKPALSVLRAPDGGVWLLPAYQFGAAGGVAYRVVAVTDEYLIEVSDSELPTTTVAFNIGGATPTSTTAPTTTPPIPVPDVLTAAIGLSLSAFEAVARTAGFTVRVVSIDGVEQAQERDFRSNRVNVNVDTGGGALADPTVVSIVGIY